MAYRFEQFLSARSCYGATVDAAGDRLYLISDMTGSPQLWSLAADDPRAWPEPVAVGLDRISAMHPSSRPGRQVFVADVGGNERTQLYLLDGLGPAPRLLTEAPMAIHLIGGWHPNGRTIVYSSNERDPRHFDVYTLDVESGSRHRLFQGDATYYAAGYSPDGRFLLIQKVDTPSDHTIYVVDAESGEARPLTRAGKPAKYAHVSWSPDGDSIYCITDLDREFMMVARMDATSGALEPVVAADWDVGDFALSPDGRRLLYELNVDGFSEIHLRDLKDGSDRSVAAPRGQACDTGRWQVTFAWFPDSTRFVCAVSTPTTTADVYLGHVDAPAIEPVTRSWKAGLDNDQLVSAELIHFPTFDGRQIPAFVFKPQDGGPAGPRPTVFLVHGGPESQLRPTFNPVIQYLTQRGLVVVAPNVRGSSGYGKTYLHLDDVELRMDSVRDLAEGAKWAAASGLSDRSRIAVMGQSYGGFMVLAAVTNYPELWAAGVDIYGIGNFVTFMENTGPWRRHLRAAEYGSLERHRERISPIHKVDQIVAPMMMIHGANDPRVPISETEQMIESLKQRGRTVEYVRFEDEGHGIVKLRNKLVAFPKIADFLEEHLGAG